MIWQGNTIIFSSQPNFIKIWQDVKSWGKQRFKILNSAIFLCQNELMKKHDSFLLSYAAYNTLKFDTLCFVMMSRQDILFEDLAFFRFNFSKKHFQKYFEMISANEISSFLFSF